MKMTNAELRERLRMLVREEQDQGRINESEVIALHRYINRTEQLDERPSMFDRPDRD